MKKILNKIKGKLFNIAVFAMLFMLLGAVLPEVFYRYFDTREYYKINSIVVDTNKTYKPCEVMELLITRTAYEDLTGEFTFVLTLEDIDNKNVYSKRVPSTVEKGERTIKSEQLIPCDNGVGKNIDEGEYRWKLGFEYEFRGIKKTALNRSNLFTIGK